jgi:hypothetical protein
LVPRWQSSERHIRLKTIMQDRPDLIESELSGLAFDSLQCVFRPKDIASMYEQPPLPPTLSETIYIMVDPAAGGPQSDYAFISFTRMKGMVQVCPLTSYATRYALRAWFTSCCTLSASLRCQEGTTSVDNVLKMFGALFLQSGAIFNSGEPTHNQRLPTVSTLSSRSIAARA